jgi:uncharacterized protein YecE (DUF72 family)
MATRAPSSGRKSATSGSASGFASTNSPSTASESATSAGAGRRGSSAAAGDIRVGIGGWVYEPWRNNFYPPGLAHARELEYASRHVTALEINATYYRLQSPTTFAKWRDATPDDFVFALKATQYATNRRVLAEAGESIGRFVTSGIAELGAKLGPIVWQFATTKQFDAADFGAFLALLPKELGALRLRHAVEVRHPSFATVEYLDLARRHGVATVFADSDEHPSFADPTADFIYARLMKTESRFASGYSADGIAQWARCGEDWAAGKEPDGLHRVEAPASEPPPRRDVFMFFISGAKERAPAAAMATLAALGRQPAGD